MKIKRVTENEIVFDNGNLITYDHEQECCECNYADFSTLNESNIYYGHDFDTELQFEFIEDEGFTFGDEIAKIFIPCYSDQNGYYSTEIEILYNGKRVLCGFCEERIY